MLRTYREINEKIRHKQAVVVTAEELIEIVEEKGTKKAAQEVDVVTTGTFGPMCSSGMLFNIGHTKPRMRTYRAYLNRVPVYCGLAAVDHYLGATEVREGDPLNSVFPGQFRYGGGHVIEELVRGKDVLFEATAYGTDCYPRKELATMISLKDMNEALLLNPRNAYQNYNVAVNKAGKRPIYTYLGILRPNMANANYCSAGQLSPLLKDPYFRTIGIGTRIFIGGAQGYVFWHGTQHDTTVPRRDNGTPMGGAGTLAVVGDVKKMDAAFLRGVSLTGYGVSLAVGIGVPIPVLDEDVVKYAAIKDDEIFAPVVDYSEDYPNLKGEPLGYVSYAQLKSGKIEIGGKTIETASLSSYPKAVEIAQLLKDWIRKGEFFLGEPVQLLPSAGSGVKFKPLKYRPVRKWLAR